jgi:pyruvate formate lyase activating enzyme
MPSVPAILATPLPDGSVRCDVCAHRCLVRPGRVGICGVRENRDGRLFSTVYGEVVAAAVDPIEKKPLFHVAPGASAYSIATVGCNFHCAFCQNWEIAQGPRLGQPPAGRHMSPDRVVSEAIRTGCESIAYTYVEPTVFLEYALDCARLARQEGLLNLFVTNGYETLEAIDLLAPVLDAANVDLKSFDDAVYRRICGARLEPVKEALVEMRRRGIWLEVTTLLLPGVNDDPDHLRPLVTWLVAELGPETPWHVSRFFPAHRWADRAPTRLDAISTALDVGREAGLLHVYGGNAPGLQAEDTFCPGCGDLLIARHGYRIERYLRPDGTCPSCRRALAGIALATRSARPCG